MVIFSWSSTVAASRVRSVSDAGESSSRSRPSSCRCLLILCGTRRERQGPAQPWHHGALGDGYTATKPATRTSLPGPKDPGAGRAGEGRAAAVAFDSKELTNRAAAMLGRRERSKRGRDGEVPGVSLPDGAGRIGKVPGVSLRVYLS